MLKGFSAVVVGGAGVAFVAGASLLLLYLAIPRTVSAFLSLPERPYSTDVYAGGEIEAQALEALVNSRHQASNWVNSGRTWSDLAMAHLLMAEVGELSSKDRLSHLRQAEGFLEASLRLAPANPHDWTRRAYVGMLLQGPTQSGASALVMSMLTARYEPDLMFARLRLCFKSWRYFSPADQNLVLDQVRLAWRQSPDRVLDITRHNAWIDILRAAFAHNPDYLADLKQRLDAQF